MTLSPITTKKEGGAAFGSLQACLKVGAQKFQRNVGWPGGHDEFTLYWHEKEHFSVVFGRNPVSRYWCAYGTMDPKAHSSVDITCEINPPVQGIDRRCGGVFLKDSASGLYLAHSGKVGGGRKGVGMNAFFDTYSGETEEIEWQDGETRQVAILGKIGSKRFIRSLAEYIHAVELFKAGVAGKTPKEVAQKNPDLAFTPEFEGPRKKYKLTGAIESQCDHGTVVNTLHDLLEAMGRKAYKTGKIDLFLADKKSNITHILEIKTDQCTTSLYQAVGQVMLHGALAKSQPHRILVLPGKVTADTAARFKRLGIRSLRYEWKGEKPIFDGLAGVVKA